MKIAKFILSNLVIIILLFSTLHPVIAEVHPALIEEYTSFGNNNGEFYNPTDVIRVNNEYYVVDTGNDRIQKFDEEWNYLDQFGSSGSANGQLDNPISITYNGTYLFVADCGNNRVSLFDLTGNFIDTFGSFGTAYNELSCPSDLEFDNDRIYIANHDSGHISVWNESSLEAITTIAPGLTPYGLAVGEDKIFVSDTTSNQIYVFRKDNLNFRYTFGSSGSGVEEFTEPADIDYRNGYVVISDFSLNKLVIYDEVGNFVSEVYSTLGGPFLFEIVDNNILIAESLLHKLSNYRATANPFNVVARSNEAAIQVSWDIDPRSGVVAPESYRVYRDDNSGLEFMGEVSDTTFVDHSTKSNMTYTYYVESKSFLTIGDRIASNAIGRELAEQTDLPEVGVNTTTETVSDDDFSLPVSFSPFVLALLTIPLLQQISKSYKQKYL